MIPVSRINNDPFFINPDLIEYIEETPDTVVSMDSGRKFVVSESIEVIVERIIEYRKRVYLAQNPPVPQEPRQIES